MSVSFTPIHLLYVPTLNCNLGCRYCYLGDETKKGFREDTGPGQILKTLETTVTNLGNHGYFPFNISLHGGEVTTLSPAALELLFIYITDYYKKNRERLEEFGVRKTYPHIKTNLFNFHTLTELLAKHRVSISASVDLPLFLHKKYRTTKMGGSSLERILENIKLLAEYPYGRKISTTLFKEHFDHKEQLADDIEKLHEEYGFDMNRFNIMFGFNSLKNKRKIEKSPGVELRMISGDEQVKLYEYLKKRFSGTNLEQGLRGPWFEEFTPTYCTNCFNCGEKFFLLQGDGNLYSCVRGQGVETFHYGNVYDTPITEIMNLAAKKVSFIHKSFGFHEDCRKCDYLHICHTGCPFVKSQMKVGKSYTCKLQKRLYEEEPEKYEKAASIEERQKYVLEYVTDMHPNELFAIREKERQAPGIALPGDFHDPGNSLTEIIAGDAVLVELYADDAFILGIDEEFVPLSSQLLKTSRDLYHLHPGQRFTLHIRKSIFEANCPEIIQNSLYIQMLRDTKVVYGDEKRTKQEHTFTHQVYFNLLRESPELGSDHLVLSISSLFELHKKFFIQGVLNNFFVTTSYLLEYHYKKQKSNGFYHIQALNLPFQNLEFFWD